MTHHSGGYHPRLPGAHSDGTYRVTKRNDGASGIDGRTFVDNESTGLRVGRIICVVACPVDIPKEKVGLLLDNGRPSPTTPGRGQLKSNNSIRLFYPLLLFFGVGILHPFPAPSRPV
jgi:hypothetical protein